MPTLRVRNSRGVESVVALDRDALVFGRSPDCNIVLDGRGVSHIHGRLFREQFGEERLLRAVSASGFRSVRDQVDSIQREVETFRGGHPQSDDITILACRRTA